MDQLETHTHSFIIKIWLEETAEEAGKTIWRGRISHVPSNERRYLNDLEDILGFIKTYLNEIDLPIENRD
ncbi:MAG: hypothetical protein JEZ06_08150 [Anaerolineaceae bacterium]|nr:hypothetical protein [Anaerolineaceae bacterium]